MEYDTYIFYIVYLSAKEHPVETRFRGRPEALDIAQLTHWARDNMAAIFRTARSNYFFNENGSLLNEIPLNSNLQYSSIG